MEYNNLQSPKVKEKVGNWESSYHINRHKEIILARLRLNCVRYIHLTPHIENTFPLMCNCDGSWLSLHHVFFNCNYYAVQRTELFNQIIEEKKEYNLKSILNDDDNFCEHVLNFIKESNLSNQI